MKKSDIKSGILSKLIISRMIPPRHSDLYYGILHEFKYQDLDASEQLIVHNIAWTQCKIVDCQDRKYLYGNQLPTMDEQGRRIVTLAEQQAKQIEQDQLQPLQKQLANWITLLRSKKNNSTVSAESDLAKAIFEDSGVDTDSQETQD